MFFVRTASERDLAKVSALLGETWHATYDALYGADKVSEITARWHSVPALKARIDWVSAQLKGHGRVTAIHLGGGSPTMLSAEDMAALKARLARKDSEFVVADNGRELGGMGYAAMAKDRPKTAFLHQLYVLPRYQRQGIGRDLFAELETCFPDANAMLLEVDPRNEAAVAFYGAHGFVKVVETQHTADGISGVPLHVYEKPLGG